MRKLLCSALSVLALLLLCGCNVNEMSTLPDLSKPYVGVYECKSLTLGGQDHTENFEKLYLNLKYDGTYSLVWRGIDGQKGKSTGQYKVDCEGETITLGVYTRHRMCSYVFPMKKGVIAVIYNFGGRLLNAEFSMP